MLEQLSLLISQSLLIAVPILLAGLGGTCSERAGVVNIALEGILLTGAFAAAVVAVATGVAWFGVIAGVGAGICVAAIHAVLTIGLGVDQIISGLALNLLTAGATEYGARLAWPADRERALPALRIDHPTGIEGFDAVLGRPLVVLSGLLVFAIWFTLERSVFGLRLTAAGEAPGACEASGVPVAPLRSAGVVLSGALAGLGGSWLAFNVGQFQHGMSAGKGYIAVAAVVFGRWHPLGVTAACLMFGFSEAFSAALERWHVPVPSELISTLPYALTIVALAGIVGRSRAPAALGLPYRKSE